MTIEKGLVSLSKDDKWVDTTNDASYFNADRKRAVASPYFANLNYAFDTSYTHNNIAFECKH